MDLKSKIILISGPTASGKSKFAIQLAKKINVHFRKIRHLHYKLTRDLESYLQKELKKNGFNDIEYLEVRESATLEHPVTIKDKKSLRVFIAVNLSGVRLIDNYKLK